MESNKTARGYASKFVVGMGIAMIVPPAVWTPIEFQVELFDELDEIDQVAPWAFVPKQRGYYHLYASVNWININAAINLSIQFEGMAAGMMTQSAAETFHAFTSLTQHLHWFGVLNPPDAIQVEALHNQVGVANLGGTWRECQFMGRRVG